MKLQKLTGYFTILACLFIGQESLAQSWSGADGEISVEKPSLTSLLLNRLEIVSIKHDEATKVHPRAELSVRRNTDNSVKDPNDNRYLSHYKNAIYNGHHEFDGSNSFVENYAGYDKESNFSFSTRVEREVSNRSVKRLMEVLTEGKVVDERQYFETQLMSFNNKKLETYTYCSGHLYQSHVEGSLRRLYRKSDKKYNQAKFSCKTLTRPLCNVVYRQEQKDKFGNFKETAFYDRLENDILDVVNYQQIQKNNMGSLKTADKPGGSLHKAWPNDPLFHHYSGLGENGTLTRREAKWVIDECKNKMVYFFDSQLKDDVRNEENTTRPSRSISSQFGGSPGSSFSSN